MKYLQLGFVVILKTFSLVPGSLKDEGSDRSFCWFSEVGIQMYWSVHTPSHPPFLPLNQSSQDLSEIARGVWEGEVMFFVMLKPRLYLQREPLRNFIFKDSSCKYPDFNFIPRLHFAIFLLKLFSFLKGPLNHTFWMGEETPSRFLRIMTLCLDERARK